MSNDSSAEQVGRVASLHLHPAEPGEAMRPVDSMELVAGKGIVGNGRHFERRSRSTGKPSRRQISLIEREVVAEHAAALGLETISPGAVRSNIETLGLDLIALLGCEVVVGDAVLFFYDARTPCAKMDAVCPGLRQLMQNNRQGVMAEVVRSGTIRVGDTIRQLTKE
jgi:MOSC domain-containing protein YiiM